MMQLHYLNEPEGELDPRPPDRSQTKAGKDIGEYENEDEEPLSFASPGQVIDALEEAFRNDKDLFLKLRGRAYKLIRFYFHTKIMYDQTPEDIVNKVLNLLISGKRKWYAEKVPDIVHLVYLVIHSLIRNERKKKRPIFRSIDRYNNDGELIETDIVDLQRAYLREDLADPELSAELEKNITRLFQELEPDTIAYFVLEALLDTDHSTVKKPEVIIAQQLQLSEPEVKNAIRRIRRRVSKLIKQI
jgi:DNA-directed RNA polymerase specialized sigma24 family protein